MRKQEYSIHLGMISFDQFQAALDRFDLGRFVRAEPIPFGSFMQNVFVTSTKGEYVLRGNPHFSWQFPTERFYVNQLHERTRVPVPWPYLVDSAQDIFGWSYVIMPRMPGLQLANPEIRNHLEAEDKRGIARALGENLALMQELTCPFSGRFSTITNTIQPFELLNELSWPFPIQSDTRATMMQSTEITFSKWVIAKIRQRLARLCECNSLPISDVEWAEELIVRAQDALNDSFQPSFVMQDYHESNLVVKHLKNQWRVSGVFDFATGHFGDGEADLSRQVGMYLKEDIQLANVYVQAYMHKRPPRAGFAVRFPVYMLADRLIIWEFLQRQGRVPGNGHWTFRDWASPYISYYSVLHEF